LKVPANTAPGTYTGTIKVKNANGCESAARTFTLTVNALISITAAATATGVTASTASQTTPLTYSATTGTPNTYSITWNPTPVNSFAAVTNTTLPASPIRVTVPANTPAGTYSGNLTVRNTGGCVSAPSVFTVTVTGIAAIAANNIAEIGNTTGLSLNNGIPPVDPDKAELLQNVPNPFHDLTQIGFYLPKSTDGYLTIRDEKGSVVYRQKATYYQGWNQVTIKNNDLKAVGVLYYTLDTPDFSATKKMILLQK
jgi:PKD repeat protein